MAMNNPNSFLRVNKAELEFDESSDPYAEQVYQRGKDNLMRLRNEGIMVRDPKPSFYLYRLTMNSRSQTGLVALTSVDEYDSGLIKKHEHTRPQKVTDRANHIAFLGAQRWSDGITTISRCFTCVSWLSPGSGVSLPNP